MTLPRLAPSRHVLAMTAALVLASCGGSDSPTGSDDPNPTPTVASVVFLTPPSAQVAGGTVSAEIRVESSAGQPMAGQIITFSASAGTVSPSSVTTSATGTATVSWTLGTTAGSQTITASSSGRSATLTLTVGPGAAAAFEKASGDAQTGAAGEQLTAPVVVTVKDGFGNVRSGEALTVAVTGGGGSVGSPTATTGSDGRASIAWILGEALGNNTLTVTHAVGTLTFTATGGAGAPASVTPVSGSGQSAPAGTELANPVVVEVKDRLGHKVGGARVAFVATSGEGSASPDTASTDAGGRAQARWILGGQAGEQTLEARAASVAPAVFKASAQTGAAAALEVVSGDGQQGTVGQPLGSAVVVKVVDAFGNGVGGVAVAFATAAAGGEVAPAQGTSGTDGRVSATWTLGTVAGAQALTAAADGLTPVAFSAQAAPGSAAEVRAAAGAGQAGTVGQSLANPLVAEVVDAFGNPVPGATVTFAPAAGSGTVTPSSGESGADGRLSTSWTLGTASGTQTVTAAVAGAPATTFTATAAPGAAKTFAKVSGDTQSGPSQSPLASPLVVQAKDTFGNGVPGVAVTFSVTAGGGSVAPASVTTGGDGTASASFTLGTTVGEHRAQASAGALGTLEFTATATSGPPAAMSKVSGDAQVRAVGDTVSVTVEVVDAFGNKVPNAAVAFTVATGGGSVAIPAASLAEGPSAAAQATGQTDATGRATARWTLGTTAGAHSLTAAVTGAGSVTFTATGTAGAAATVTKVAGDNQSATVATAVATAPRVKVVDAFGNAVSGVSVTFAVASGGGSVTGATVVTAADGTASVGSWTLGSTAGTNTLTATAAGLIPVTFTATATAAAPATFDIEIRIIGSMSAGVQAAFSEAEARWEQVVTGDLSNVSLTADQVSQCENAPAEALVVDDLVIYVEVAAIDGAGGTLGSAGPCWTRASNGLPIVGNMKFDEADLADMASDGTLVAVVLHEMGHVLGIGTLWDTKGLIQAAGSDDPFFSGVLAIGAFQGMGGALVNGVPVENTGGEGTRDGHWRETVFQNELMTGYISGPGNPLSLLSVQSLADMGYAVSSGASDSYTLPAPAPGPQRAPVQGRSPWEVLLKPVGALGGDGEVR